MILERCSRSIISSAKAFASPKFAGHGTPQRLSQAAGVFACEFRPLWWKVKVLVECVRLRYKAVNQAPENHCWCWLELTKLVGNKVPW